MEETPDSSSSAQPPKARRRSTSTRPGKRSPASKAKASAGKSPRKPARRTSPARTGRRRAGVLSKKSLEGLLDALTSRASGTRDRIAAFSEESVSATRRTLEQASVTTRTAVDRLSREWKRMTPARRAQLAAALLTALAAASAPVVKSRWKKK